MICPKCNAQNKDGSRFCKACGSQLVVTADRGNKQKTKKIVFGSVAALLLVAIIGVLVWLHPFPNSTPALVQDSTALFSDGVPLVAGVDGKAHMRLRVPENVKSAAVYNSDGNQVAFFQAMDMHDEGDGYKWAELDVDVPARDVGVEKFTVLTDVNKGEKVANTDVDESHGATVLIVPESEDYDPVRSQGTWILANACDWVSQNCNDMTDREEAAAALVEYLAQDGRAKTPTQYGSCVLFGVGDNNNSALYCISLSPIAQGMLGMATDHSFVYDDPAIKSFLVSDGSEILEKGSGITSGNTITSADVLLLEPTPALISKRPKKTVDDACSTYASALGGTFTKKEGDEALVSILSGDLYGKGVVVLQAHGINARGSGISLMQMRSATKSMNEQWDTLQTDLSRYIHSIVESTSANMGELCFGLPDEPETWRCAITAQATGDSEVWEVGVSMTTNLLKSCYGKKSFDESIIILSSCNSIQDSSFAEWSLANGAQLVLGYEGVVGEEGSAQDVQDLLSGMLTSSKKTWRNMNVAETHMPESSANGLDSSTSLIGNDSMFAKGTATLSGVVVSKDNDAGVGAIIKAWRYFGLKFSLQGTTMASSDGTFGLSNLPCGRYVITAEADDKRNIVTIVLDDEYVDGGKIELGVGNYTFKNSNTQSSATVSDSFEPETYAADLGTSNKAVTADDEWYYLGVSSSYQEGSTSAKPRIIRVSRKDTSNYKVLWEGGIDANITEVRKKGNKIFAYLYPWSDQGGKIVLSQIVSVNLDGTDGKTVVQLQSPTDSSQAFICSDDRVFYGYGYGDSWKVCSSSINGGSSETVVCGGKSIQGDAMRVHMIGLDTDELVFGVPSNKSDSGFNTVYAAKLDGSGSCREIMRTGGLVAPMLYDGRIYTASAGELVSYSLMGSDRKVVATFAKGERFEADEYPLLYNMNSRYALVVGKLKSWLIDMSKGSEKHLSDFDDGMSISIVDDELITVSNSQSIQRCDLGLNANATLWPKKDASEKTPMSTESPAQTTTTNSYTLSGRVRVHKEQNLASKKFMQVVSIVLDNPVSYTFDYKGTDYDAEAHEVALSTDSSDDYDAWAQYDGKHITLLCETLRGVYHDAIYLGVDTMGLGEINLVSVDS